ncbi:unnamed protein product [Phaeothamnion confervicola]
MANADEGLQPNESAMIDVEAGNPLPEPLPSPLLDFLAPTQRIQQWKRTRHTSTSIWWILGRGWSKHRNGELKGTIICENYVVDWSLHEAEVNYGSSKSTGKVSSISKRITKTSTRRGRNFWYVAPRKTTRSKTGSNRHFQRGQRAAVDRGALSFRVHAVSTALHRLTSLKL